MVSVLPLSVVDLEFDTRSDQIKVYEMLFVASPLSTQQKGERVKTDLVVGSESG